MRHQSVINENKQKSEIFLSYPILCPLCQLHKKKETKMKFTQFRIYFNVARQVHIVREKGCYKTWKLGCSSPQYRGEMVYQTMHCSNRKSWQGIETEISSVDNEKIKCA